MREPRGLVMRSGGPDFIGIGVQKCGTTWIGDVLEQHPNVLLRRKEVNFFVRHFHRGYRWYHRWFEGRGDRKAGEITPNYIISPRPDTAHLQFYPRFLPRDQLLFWRRKPSARDEIAASYPGIKIFAIFRHPVERAWSHYWMWRNRKEKIGKGHRVVPFAKMFLDDGRWLRSTGYYHRHLARWREVFPEMGIFFHDDLKADPLALARSIYAFLGLDLGFVPRVEVKVNAGRYAGMPAEDRTLALDAYREETELFAAAVGRDLSSWLE